MGYFKKVIIFLLLITFHEFGHFTFAKIFSYKIDYIYIYPFGGVVKFNDYINRPFYEEFLVTIMGPIFQIIFSFFLIRIDSCAIDISNYLLFFNLLPINPLDGGKLLSIIFFKFKSYYGSIKFIIYLSYIILFLSLLYTFYNSYYFLFISLLMLVFKVFDEHKKIYYYFNKFLLERYLHHFKYKKSIIIENIIDMYKYKNNLIIYDNNLLSEKDILDNYFKL